jgi:hypothetical protein
MVKLNFNKIKIYFLVITMCKTTVEWLLRIYKTYLNLTLANLTLANLALADVTLDILTSSNQT